MRLRLNRGGIDADKRGVVAIGMGVDIARRDLFACSRRTGQHHPAIRFGHLVEIDIQLFEGSTCTDHLCIRDILAFELHVLAAQATGLHGAAEHHH